MMCHDSADNECTRRFREVAIPCLDDVYRLAYFLMRSRTDAEDAVQECYLRAWRHFENWRGLSIKPWLLAILRNVCFSEFSHGRREMPADLADCEPAAEQILWKEPQASAESEMLNREQGAAVRQIVLSLPTELREVIVLREFNDMSYREIAEVAGVPIGTVMSRLARARAVFAGEWNAQDGGAPDKSAKNAQARPRRLSKMQPSN
jgi:RNA polymerase sigma-70 factor, ECF subfamily